MKIAVVHSFYSSALPSGENRIVEDQVARLASAGMEVKLFGVTTDSEQRQLLYGPRTALRVLRRTGVGLISDLRTFEPDVIHVHNTFPNVGSRWLRAWNGPTVMTIHNYRAACSNGLLLRDGRICHDCLEPKLRWSPAVRHSCYRSSRAATLPVAISREGFRSDLVESGVIAVTGSTASDRLFRIITQGCVPSVVIPNFVEDYAHEEVLHQTGRRGWIVVSRLTPEKGVVDLVRAWPQDKDLTVVGSGPEMSNIALAANTKPRIRLIPSLPRSEIRDLLSKHLGFVLPSRWHEVAPQVVVEAMCAGLPIVAFADNDVAPTVEAAGAGRAYSDADELENALGEVESNWDSYNLQARSTYLHEWTPDIWQERILDLYRKVAK